MKSLFNSGLRSAVPAAALRPRQCSLWRRVGCASMLVLLTACSSFTKRSATPELVTQLRSQAVAQTVGDAQFRFLTGQDGAKFAVVAVFTGGILGGAVLNDSAVTKGKELSELGSLSDPGRKVADTLATRLKSTFQMAPLGPLGVSESDNLGQILQLAPSAAAFVLDVRTGAWGGTYLPTQWNRYRLAYSMKARLIDRARNAVVAEGFCDYQNRSESNPPSYEDLIADRAAMIRQRMDAYAAECADEVWSQMFPVSSLQAPLAPAPKPELVAVALTPPTAVPVAGTVQPLRGKAEVTASTAAAAPPKPAAHPMSPQAEQRYQVYLSKPNPKAFALADNGESWMAWGESLNPMVRETVPQRAVRGCEERSRARCVLYSVDGKVLSGPKLEGQR